MDIRKLSVHPVMANDGKGGALQLVYWPKGKGHPDGGVYAVTPLRWDIFREQSAKEATSLLATVLGNALETLIYIYDRPADAARAGVFGDVADIDAEVARIRRLRGGTQ